MAFGYIAKTLSALTLVSTPVAFPIAAQATNLSLVVTCTTVEGLYGAQFEGVLNIAEAANSDSREVTSDATFELLGKRKVLEGPENAPVAREILEPFTSNAASAVSEYIPAGQLYIHETTSLNVVSEESDGTKTVFRAIIDAPGVNATLLHNGLPYRAHCSR